MTKSEIKSLAQEAISTHRFFSNDVWELRLRDWKKYGKDRTYMDAVRYKPSGAISKTIKLGFFDNANGEYIVGRNEFDVVEQYIH